MAKTEKLEIEGDDARAKRLQHLLEKMSTNEDSNTSQINPSARPAGLPSFDFGNRSTGEFTPNTELLSRIQAFLPQLEASNRELLQRAQANPGSVDIEHLEPGQDGYIEMVRSPHSSLLPDSSRTTLLHRRI
ncbi:hypothetical protein DFP72DRAFT_544485 [Ephemerocybe angulata]|uniref:Uncharacterized protein n=1 Tax=Ephemerocybe angulata TaxID=980116 RepID=A0A8H6HP10_9AGAR|nr:hypothetical protein DFP72DRAFT_544485 [Tulosesus angulatus]